MGNVKMAIPKTVRVIPDLPAVSKEFDYLIPDDWIETGLASRLRIGSMVRVQLGHRSIGAWVSEINPESDHGVELQPLKKLSSEGPLEEVVDLVRWAAKRWHGPVSRLLKTSSPPKMVKTIPPTRLARPMSISQNEVVSDAFGSNPAVVRLPPNGDRWPFIRQAVSMGNALILLPSVAEVNIVANRLKRLGVYVGVYNKDWSVGLSGGTIVGSRSAAFASVKDLGAILMIDEHDEVFQEESSPTWHARDVLLERSRREDIPCVFVTPIPTPEIRHQVRVISVDQDSEKQGWSKIQVVDPREDSSAIGGLWPRMTVDALKKAERPVVVLNRTGRSRLLACGECGDLVTCTECGGAMHQPSQNLLECARYGHSRPVLCSACLSTHMKNLRLGVTRAVEELEALLNESVTEVTKATTTLDFQKSRIYLGTEAVLHRIDWADLVVFADFDQELLAKRYRGEEQAMAQLVRAIRLVNTHGDDTGNVIVQSRQPSHGLFRMVSSGDIEAWCRRESNRRELIKYPPFGHLASISGPGSEEFIEGLKALNKVEILGPNEGAWLVKSLDVKELVDSLSRVPRPKERLRIAIDPARF